MVPAGTGTGTTGTMKPGPEIRVGWILQAARTRRPEGETAGAGAGTGAAGVLAAAAAATAAETDTKDARGPINS
jgi:hypothetical protein